jgi:FkbM family methyltransferase
MPDKLPGPKGGSGLAPQPETHFGTPIRLLEKSARWVKNLPVLKKLPWDIPRRWYGAILDRLYPGGFERDIDGSERMLTLASIRAVGQEHEPEAHRIILGAIQPGDTVADVGASAGLYTIPMARRVGDTGRVFAFEPDEQSFKTLRRHVELNGVSQRVELIRAAVADERGSVRFISGQGPLSHIAPPGNTAAASSTECVRLDDVFADSKVAVMKVDVEGYEEKVLRGAARLLTDPDRSPSVVLLDLHPFAWQGAGLTTTQESLVVFLNECGYRVETLQGHPVVRTSAPTYNIAAYKSRASR